MFREGLYQEVRRELLSGIGANPAEPALHLLLGHVYDRIGLKKLAAGAFEKVRGSLYLMTVMGLPNPLFSQGLTTGELN